MGTGTEQRLWVHPWDAGGCQTPTGDTQCAESSVGALQGSGDGEDQAGAVTTWHIISPLWHKHKALSPPGTSSSHLFLLPGAPYWEAALAKGLLCSVGCRMPRGATTMLPWRTLQISTWEEIRGPAASVGRTDSPWEDQAA